MRLPSVFGPVRARQLFGRSGGAPGSCHPIKFNRLLEGAMRGHPTEEVSNIE